MTLTVAVIVIVVFALTGGLVAGATSRWRRERRADHGEALDRLRDLAHRYGVDEDRGSPVASPVRHAPSEAPSPWGISPEGLGTPRHAAREQGYAEPRSPGLDPQSRPRHSPASASAHAALAPSTDVPRPRHSAELVSAPVGHPPEGFRWLEIPSGASEPRVAGEAARVVGALDDHDAREWGVEANARLTATTGLLLIVLFFFEGLTIPVIGRFLTWHVAIGLALIPPVLLKIGSTLWRFGHYYRGDRRYVRAGPPHPALRVLGPFVIISTVLVIASGVALWLVGPTDHLLLRVHQLTFVLWFIVVAVHMVAHLSRATRLAAADGRDARSPGHGLPGARTRRWVVAASLVIGVVVGGLGVTVTTGWSHRTAQVPGRIVVRQNGQKTERGGGPSPGRTASGAPIGEPSAAAPS